MRAGRLLPACSHFVARIFGSNHVTLWRAALSRGFRETLMYFVWQGAIFFQAGVDSSVLDCFKKVEQHRQTE
jgi:hypothetical protein